MLGALMNKGSYKSSLVYQTKPIVIGSEYDIEQLLHLGDGLISSSLTSELFPRHQRIVTIARDRACHFQASLDVRIVRQTNDPSILL